MSSEAGENPRPPAFIDSPDVRYSGCGVFSLRRSFSTGRFFTPLLFHNPYSGEIFLMLKLMLQFVLNKVGQIFRCMFMSGANNGGSCVKDIIAKGKRLQVHRLVCDLH